MWDLEGNQEKNAFQMTTRGTERKAEYAVLCQKLATSVFRVERGIKKFRMFAIYNQSPDDFGDVLILNL